MFNAISTFIGSAWEALGQFPADFGGFEEAPKAENPLGSALAKRMEVMPLVQTGGNKVPKAENPLGSALAKRMEVIPLVPTGGYNVPKYILLMIFIRLPPHKLLEAGLVCKLWYQLSSSDFLWKSYHLQEAFPKATFIDGGIWETYIDVKKYGWEMNEPGRPYVDKWDYIELKRIESAVEDNKSFTVLTLYKKHKLEDALDFAGSGKAGYSTRFGYILPRIVAELEKEEIQETVIVAVTNNVFKNSRNKTVEEQQERVEELSCEMPGLLPVMDVALMTHRMSTPAAFFRTFGMDPEAPTRLFGDDPPTYTRLKQKIGESSLAFGGFAPLGGPDASHYDFVTEIFGVAGLRKFKVIKTDIKK